VREAKFLVGLATILFFIGIFFFKGLSKKKSFKEDISQSINTPLKRSAKIALILSGILSILLSLLLFWQSIKLI